MNKDNPFFDNDELQPTAEILAAIDTEQSLELPIRKRSKPPTKRMQRKENCALQSNKI